MNTPERRCPECNAIIKPGESFCLNCGATVQQEESAVQAEQSPIADFTNVTTDSVPVSDGDVISRSNITGSVYKTNNTSVNNTSNTTVNDSSNTTTNNTSNVNTNVINRSTSTSNSNNVTNTTNTIINQQAAPEFCTVCGRSLNDGNKARCPKCQKTICSACLVSGKNRCTECEKKAVDEYRLAYQELLYTTNGNIGVAGERLMKRKAEELNVIDSAKRIEDDILAMFKGSTRQQAQPAQTEESKGVGSLSGRKPLTMSKDEKKTSKGGGSKLILAVVLLIAAAGGYFYFIGNDKKADTVTEAKNEQIEAKKEAEPKKEAEVKKETEVKKVTEPKKEAEVKKVAAAAQQATQAPVQTASSTAKKSEQVAKDSNYEEGMKAYEAKNGVEAIKKFKASGSAKSQYMIGVIYENGCGTITKNAMKARQAFKEAAKLGSEEAKAKL